MNKKIVKSSADGMIYSDSLGEMVVDKFKYKGKIYEWNDSDCVWYNKEVDDDYFMEMPESAEIIKSSRKLSSAVDGGWEVDSSEVPEALDLFVEYFGEETALEEIAKAMGTDTLEENLEWICRQWGISEEIEDLDDTWDKYERAKEIMGESELFNNLTQAAGYDELAEDLAFIFRQYDFREWDERNEEIESSRKINSSQKGFENVAEGTQYDDYHIDTRGMGILDVEHIIAEIEGRGNQAVLTVQPSDGSTNHSHFTSDSWKQYKDAVNGVDEFARNSGNHGKGAAITDVWVTEVEGGSYVRNSRKAVKSGVPFKNRGFNLTGHEIQDMEWRINSGEVVNYNGWTFTKDDDFDTIVATSPEGKTYDGFKSLSGFMDLYEYGSIESSRHIKSARYVATDSETGEVLGSADTYEEAVAQWGDEVKNVDTEMQSAENIVSKVVSCRLTEKQALQQIMQSHKCNEGYAKKLLSNWMDIYKDELLSSGVNNVLDDVNSEFDVDGNFESWSRQYVPQSGKASTVGGELLRAANQILSGWQIDGDKIGIGNGKKTVNSAARFIAKVSDYQFNNELNDLLSNATHYNDYQYGEWCDIFQNRFEDYLRDNSYLFSKVNRDDMWLFSDNEMDGDTEIEECVVEDTNGVEYHLEPHGDGFECVSIDGIDPGYEVGDELVDGDVYTADIDAPGEYGEFTVDGVIYDFEATDESDNDEHHHSWKITNIRVEDGFAEEGDIVSLDELLDIVEGNQSEFTIRDDNGNVIDESQSYLLESALIKSSSAFVDDEQSDNPECIISINVDGKWEPVGIDNSAQGWNTSGKYKVFKSEDAARHSGLVKRLDNAGYSEGNGNLRFETK